MTGGADGIGWAIAQRFAAGGHRLVIADLRAEAAEARARTLGEGHLALGCDVASEPAVRGDGDGGAGGMGGSTCW